MTPLSPCHMLKINAAARTCKILQFKQTFSVNSRDMPYLFGGYKRGTDLPIDRPVDRPTDPRTDPPLLLLALDVF